MQPLSYCAHSIDTAPQLYSLPASPPKAHHTLCRLVKAGLIDKRYAKRFSTISAWGELVGYVGNVTLNCLRISVALERETLLTQELLRRRQVGHVGMIA